MSVSVGMFEGGAAAADATTVVVDMPIMGMSGKAAFVDMTILVDTMTLVID